MDNLSEYQGFNQPKFKYNQIRKQRLWRFLWKECSWKLGAIVTKACKGIQCLGKLYTAIMKPLPLKLIPSQVPLTKISNFSNNYALVHITFCWKSSTRIDREKFRKMFKNTAERLFSNQHCKEFLCSFLLKNGITHKKVCLWWGVVVSCISHASGKVLAGFSFSFISVNHNISAAWKNRFYHTCLTTVIFGANIHYFHSILF